MIVKFAFVVQYSVCFLKKNLNAPRLFEELFLTFSVLVANPKKLLYTVANPARGLLNREKRTKEKIWRWEDHGCKYFVFVAL